MLRKLMLLPLLAVLSLGGAAAGAADFSTHKSAVIFYSLLHNREGGDAWEQSHPVGNTEIIADLIVKQTGADKFSLVQAQPYSNDYDEVTDLARTEQEEQVRPALKKVPDLSAYDVVFVGFPCWWGSYPMAFATYFETGALKGKTVVPFTTHMGSRFGHALTDLEKALPDSRITEGLAIRGSDVSDSDTAEQVTEFLQDLQL